MPASSERAITMKTLLLLAMLVAFGFMQAHGSLLDFQRMILFKTGKRADISYGAYGCHCGWGGKGTPKDATDRCCATHDCCYSRLKKRGCGTKLLGYKFTYRGGQITCSEGRHPDAEKPLHAQPPLTTAFLPQPRSQRSLLSHPRVTRRPSAPTQNHSPKPGRGLTGLFPHHPWFKLPCASPTIPLHV
ncbi:phospholipase A2, membrane associated isoform X1 [Dipodomys merriami]|uniref:phospholipase A2, membrane associated isoform X1 n=1 Tax=Dipodomys merriami TaxID=94247 RepID=UPI003855A1C8